MSSRAMGPIKATVAGVALETVGSITIEPRPASAGIIYLIHFERKLAHAQHYVGFCVEEGLAARMERHTLGTGSKLLKAVVEAGIQWTVVRTWLGDRHLERRIKKRKLTRAFCPVCSVKPREIK